MPSADWLREQARRSRPVRPDVILRQRRQTTENGDAVLTGWLH